MCPTSKFMGVVFKLSYVMLTQYSIVLDVKFHLADSKIQS